MKQLYTEIEIQATPAQIWAVLMEFEKYPNWNPFITQISGTPQPKKTLTILLEPDGNKPVKIKPKVRKVEVNRYFSWLGRLFFPGIFDGEHIFEIKPIGNNQSLFVQRENFRGILVFFLRKFLDTKTKAGFIQMNEALKKQVEGNQLIAIR